MKRAGRFLSNVRRRYIETSDKDFPLAIKKFDSRWTSLKHSSLFSLFDARAVRNSIATAAHQDALGYLEKLRKSNAKFAP